MRLVVPFLLMPATVTAEPHWMSVIYQEAPCSEIIATIDAPNLEGGSVKAQTERLGRMTMAFGFLLGYQAATRPLNADKDTVLQKFREVCAADPGKTGLQVLDVMSGK